ncbi:MAG: acetyl/propionyl-CoA carboxylase subunit alpha, partial [Acidimicrobiales bacterium]|nr:acetyl/propionyl-CoA carboxylase subunit alpha [Acidimicrobiales bacterium]
MLVANRGEIARRVFRTCRTLGLGTVAVHSDPDADAAHVREADAAVRLPGAAAADTYLRTDRILDAAARSGADAIHPGYGFLSENAAFARAVVDAGLVWIGPPPDAIEAMGSKVGAKALMAAAGVPTLPDLDPAEVTEADLPVLVKASAGGGGRGMRIVTDLAALPSEVDAARAEAEAAFGDPTVFCEPFLATGHHVEVQVMADRHGTVWAVGERECSVQRRHQKVVEEAPSPLVARVEGMRDRLFEASVAAARAIGYQGAGTVEFLASVDGSFHFLEVNTRLQVEHPVTEATTGLDLVALQIAVASGAPLPAPAPPPTVGHAVEARLYAEDPAAGWTPQSGTLHRFAIPGTEDGGLRVDSAVRLDSGVVDGDEVGIHYDPMLAKVIVHAPTRDEAARRLAGALAGATIHGLTTNRDLLVRVLRDPEFLAGGADTGFLGRRPDLAEPRAGTEVVGLAADAAALAASAAARDAATVQRAVPAGWRNVPSQPLVRRFRHGDDEIEVRYRFRLDGHPVLDPDDGSRPAEVVAWSPTEVALAVRGVSRRFHVARHGDEVWVDSPLGSVRLGVADRYPSAGSAAVAGSLLAPLPGAVARVAVAVGDRVVAGQPLLWLEAMKVQHEVAAPIDGTVVELPVGPGDQVDKGAVLAVVAPDGADAAGRDDA